MLTCLLYIDPGSGSYLVQVIVAALLGAAFWIKMSWHRIKSFFGGNKLKEPANKEESEGQS
jgi:hypothetical protein